MITYEWTVIIVVKDDFRYGRENVVRDVTFQIRAFKDGQMREVHFACAIPPPGDDFIPFEELTDEHYFEWCWKHQQPKARYEESIATLFN